MSSSKSAIVVGGSLGGLFTGIVLKRLGYHVTIFERSPTPLLQDQGAGIVAGGDTLRFLRQFDKTKRDVAVVSPLRHYLDKHGDEIHREEWTQKMTSWDLLYHLLRANFDGMSSDYVQAPEDAGSAKYEYGCNVTNISVKDQKIEATYTDRDMQVQTVKADQVFGADGPSSTVRGMLAPRAKRIYAGYVAWRGTVLESLVSQATKNVFVEKFTFFHADGIQVASPVRDSRTERYSDTWAKTHQLGLNYPDKTEVMTDKDGKTHPWTNHAPPESLIDKQRKYAKEVLPPQFAELIELTEKPFIQAIADVLSPHCVFYDGRVVLCGDAVAQFRPHTAASTSQAAFHALKLDEYLRQTEVEWREFEDEVLEYARNGVEHGIKLGNWSQFQKHPMSNRLAMADS